MNCLLISNPQCNETKQLLEYLQSQHVLVETITEAIVGIEKAQEQHFDVIVMDAKPKGIKIDKAIRLLKGCIPNARIIVHTNENSKRLEANVRKEQIYYYHINSFGMQDLTTAVATALGIKIITH